MSKQQHFHFIGICGTAMGSVAVAMRQRGFQVSGSDAGVYPPMSHYLAEQDIEVMNGYAATNLSNAANSIVVIGNALSRGNEEVEAVLEQKLLYLSLPEVLKQYFLAGRRNFVVSGTHGKTTTTSMLAWFFESAELDPGYMIGGLARNLERGAKFTDSEFFVIEGDEYDTAFFDKRSKFLHYLPEVAIINNIEFDHADIYETLADIKLSFRRLLNIVPRNGCAIINGDDENCLDVATKCQAPVLRVGFGENCDHQIVNVDFRPGRTRFELDGEIFILPMDGEFNVRNAAMAITAAKFAGLEVNGIKDALSKFQGVARRQELRGEARGVRVIDDFAHHPTAIAHAIEAIRQRYPSEGRIWAIFEPRSNTSQRNVFQKELATALAHADCVFVAGISNPEKVPAEIQLSTEEVVAAIQTRGREAYHAKDGATEIIDRLVPMLKEGDVVTVLSNGGFDNIHRRLLERLAE